MIPATAEVWVPEDDDAKKVEAAGAWPVMPGGAPMTPGRDGRFVAPSAEEREALIQSVLEQVVDALGAGVGGVAEVGPGAWPDRKARRKGNA
jgi:hypothetical protein